MEDRSGLLLVDTYRIDRLIGAGGMGSVWEASHVRLPKRVAVKFLNLSLLGNVEALLRFRREAEVIAGLEHPSIVNLLDYNLTDDGVPYIVLEFLDGEHLGKRLEKGKLTIGEAMGIFVPVGQALQFAHRRDVVHRDLKPENIILARSGQVKVVDFGIAKIRGGVELTAVNSILGTIPYMAPEQLVGGKIDARTDQFALGAIVYEMLAGEMAFGGDSLPEAAAKVAHREPPPIEGAGDAVNRALARALAKRAEARFPSVEAFARALVAAASAGASRGRGVPVADAATALIARPPTTEDADDPIADPPSKVRTDPDLLPPAVRTEPGMAPPARARPNSRTDPDVAPPQALAMTAPDLPPPDLVDAQAGTIELPPPMWDEATGLASPPFTIAPAEAERPPLEEQRTEIVPLRLTAPEAEAEPAPAPSPALSPSLLAARAPVAPPSSTAATMQTEAPKIDPEAIERARRAPRVEATGKPRGESTGRVRAGAGAGVADRARAATVIPAATSTSAPPVAARSLTWLILLVATLAGAAVGIYLVMLRR